MISIKPLLHRSCLLYPDNRLILSLYSYSNCNTTDVLFVSVVTPPTELLV